MFQLVVAGLVLVGTVAAGTIAHELSHAVSLAVVGVPFEVRILGSGTAAERGRLSGALVSVVPDRAAGTPFGLRVAALMPFTLALPFLLVPLGVAPDPFTTGSLSLQLAVVGWLACAIPSPQDFSVVWYADRELVDAS